MPETRVLPALRRLPPGRRTAFGVLAAVDTALVAAAAAVWASLLAPAGTAASPAPAPVVTVSVSPSPTVLLRIEQAPGEQTGPAPASGWPPAVTQLDQASPAPAPEPATPDPPAQPSPTPAVGPTGALSSAPEPSAPAPTEDPPPSETPDG